MPFDYDNINLVPRKCIVGSRSECNTSMNLGKFTFCLPVVPANMECVINDTLAEQLASKGYFYIIHRFYTDEQILLFCRTMKEKNLYISLSLGVNQESYELVETLKKNDIVPDFLTIDIAHGHSIKMEKMLMWLRNYYAEQCPFLIAGNVSTPEGVTDLSVWGADAIKVGIGPGSACTTYPTTGFGSRGIQAWTIQECARNSPKPIIADGGIKTPGDIAKSIALGAQFCMVGGIFSSLSDSPGSTILGVDGLYYKEFWGSASASQSGKTSRIEGVKKMNRMINRTMLQEMKYIEECLQSAISYGGGKYMTDLSGIEFTQ